MKRTHVYFLLALALFAQLTVLRHVMIFGAVPDLMLIIVIFYGLFFGPAAGLESGAAAGVLKDLYTLDYFGINTFVYAAAGLAAGILNEKFYKESKPTQALLVLSFTVFSESLHYLLSSVFSKSLALNYREYFLGSILPAGVYTALIALPVFAKLIDLYGLKRLEELL